MPDLDLYDRDWPIWTYGEITPPAKFVHDDDGPARHGGLLAGLGRLHRLGRGAVALAAVHRRARPFLFATVHEAVILPYVEIGRGARLQQGRSSIAACAFPTAWWSAKIPMLDAKRFRRTEDGICLITQPMIDKLAR